VSGRKPQVGLSAQDMARHHLPAMVRQQNSVIAFISLKQYASLASKAVDPDIYNHEI
jgi:hypothetical protein